MRGKILITGGAGTLGNAIVTAAERGGWDCTFTIYSRDFYKQLAMRAKHPNCRYVLGDIRDADLYKTFAGHDLVIHAAAMKHIPQGEKQPRETHSINVDGSLNVLHAAAVAGVKDLVMISTDKVCHPVNVYGATKLLMERAAQEFALSPFGKSVNVHLVRYGNVIGSNGSVLQVWAEQNKAKRVLGLTAKEMTRFWITEAQAVTLIEDSLKFTGGSILIPQLPSMEMGAMAAALFPDSDHAIIGLRPGEKMHEELITPEERPYTHTFGDYFLLYPVSMPPVTGAGPGYTSDIARRITAEEMREMAAECLP